MGSLNLSTAAKFMLDSYEKDTIAKGPNKQRGRKDLIEKRGQILVVTYADFKKGLTSYENYNYGSVKSKGSEWSSLWTQAKDVIKTTLPKIKDPELLALITDEIRAIRSSGIIGDVKFTGKTAAFVNITSNDLILPLTNYSGATGLKKGDVKLDKLLEDYYDGRFKRKEDVKYKKAGTFWQAGHGQFGIATSQADLQRSVERGIKKFNLNEGDAKIFRDIVMESQQEAGITIKHEVICKDDGTYKNSFIPIVSLQDASENSSDAAEEKALVDIAKAHIEQIATNPNAPGSPTQAQMYERALQKYFFRRLSKSSNIKLNFIGKNTILKDSNPTQTRSFKKKSAAFPIVRADAGIFLASPLRGLAAKEGKKKKRAQPQKMNTAVLLGQINQDLGKRVEANMGRPGLRSDTGRFADSARATAILPGGNGVGLINYTYMKNPYQVFESGTGYPSAFDPRHVIEKSIRELATRQLETKFVLRRV